MSSARRVVIVPDMARLDSTKRGELPDSAFAYVDSRGRRRLPINDEAHVRNALARFNQVVFEDERARERARKRLLNAAKKYGIVPVGFITGQLQSERELGRRRAREPVGLPSGFVTMLMTDVEGSTALVQRLGERYHDLINDVRAILSDTSIRRDGQVVETRADEFFAVFEQPGPALDAAVAIQRELRGRTWGDGLDVRCGPASTAARRRSAPRTTSGSRCTLQHGSAPPPTADKWSCRRRHGTPARTRRRTACASGAWVSIGCAACRRR